MKENKMKINRVEFTRLRTQRKLKESKQWKDFTKDKILTYSKFGNPIWIKKD